MLFVSATAQKFLCRASENLPLIHWLWKQYLCYENCCFTSMLKLDSPGLPHANTSREAASTSRPFQTTAGCCTLQYDVLRLMVRDNFWTDPQVGRLLGAPAGRAAAGRLGAGGQRATAPAHAHPPPGHPRPLHRARGWRGGCAIVNVESVCQMLPCQVRVLIRACSFSWLPFTLGWLKCAPTGLNSTTLNIAGDGRCGGEL